MVHPEIMIRILEIENHHFEGFDILSMYDCMYDLKFQ